ncbi:hypothetical protein COV61_00975 [Candidatus Micrarchaeota archaeon CG11_big_fil_rev_8_21_14_0_20_47_5]|nr:MAG: hypothetical protein AUJ17_01270 [Candidatus Micrarchaeota archaeon CG1_02_47_40]PIN84164.1 MAG: hypothetical protein COV61_00975 [Candidatus Micrarchaeota archaeon CG11_big_fil_rev_8_21_14_0_20_47_5]
MAELKTGQAPNGQNIAASNGVKTFFNTFISGNNRTFLENDWRKTMGKNGENFFGKPPAEQNRLFVLFAGQAREYGIPRMEKLKFIREKQYEHRIKHPQEMGKNQLPCLVFITNGPSAHRAFNNRFKYTENGTLFNGTFALASISANPQEAKSNQDFQAVYYILNHNAHESVTRNNNHMPPYIIVCTQCKNGDEASFLEAAELSLARTKKLRKDATSAGHLFVGRTWKFQVGKTNANVHLPAVVHAIGERRFYVVEKKKGRGGLKKLPFEDWCAQKGISEHPIVAKHLENLRLHAQDEHYVKALETASASVIWECTDSRRFPELTATTYRLIGSIPSDEEFLRIAKDGKVEETEFVIHVKCGYINTAVAIHKMFDEILNRTTTGEKHISRKRISEALKRILKGKTPSMGVEAILNEIGGVSETNAATFKKLFGSSDDSTRSVFRHMYARGLFEMSDGKHPLPFMTAAKTVVDALEGICIKNSKVVLPNGLESFLIHEQIARELKDRLLLLLQNHAEEIKSARTDGKLPDISVTMAGLSTARKWLVPDGISADLTRTDSILKEILQTELMQKEL